MQHSTHPFVNLIVQRPKTFLITGLIFIIALGLGAIGMKSDFSYRIWFEEGSDRLALFDAFERQFGNDESAVLVIHSPSGIFDKDSAELLIKMSDDVWKVPEVLRVDSLSNFNWVHADQEELIIEPLIPDDEPLTDELLQQRKEISINHPSILNYLISADAKTAIIYGRLRPNIGTKPKYEEIVNGMRAVVNKYKDHTDHSFYLTGNTFLTHAFNESSQRDAKILMPLVFGLTVVFLILSLKNWGGVFIPMGVIALTVIGTLGTVGWAGMVLGTLTSIVPQFMIAVSIAVVVHVLIAYYQFLSLGMEKEEAIVLSFSKNLRPTLLTSISTTIGFVSFTGSEIPQIAEMGAMAAVGAFLSWILTYWLVAPLLVLLPKPKKIKKSDQSPEHIGEPSPRAIRYTNWLDKYRLPIMLFYALLCGVSIYGATKIEVNSDPFEYFDPTYSLSIANHFMEDHVGGSLGPEIIVDSGEKEGIKDPIFLNKVDKLQNWIGSFEFVTKTVSILDILKDMNKNLNGGAPEEYRLAQDRREIAEQLFLYTMSLPQGMDINDQMTLENESLRITAMWNLHNTNRALQFVRDVQDKASELDLNTYVTGKNILYAGNNPLVVNSFVTSISLAIFLVSVLLIIGLKSFQIGLLSLIPNTIPLILGASLLPIYGIYLDIGTVIVGSVCLGIAVDDTIHFLAIFRRQIGLGYSSKEAVAYIMTYTAPALFTTTIVLVLAFASFTLALFVPNQNFGKFVAIILSIALIADLTFLPAMVLSLTRYRNPSKKA